jgi:hypothetical protein
LRGKGKREKFASLTTQHFRNRLKIDAISESKVGATKCANFTFTINYEDEYKVWKNFSMMYQSRMYRYNEYRVTDDGQVCNSSDPLIQQRWQNFIVREKNMTVLTHCNVSVDGFYFENYTLLKNFTVSFHLTEQSFTRQDYRVIFGHFAIYSGKLSLSCNDDLVKVKYTMNNTMFSKTFRCFTTTRCTIIVNNDSETTVLKCVLRTIQEFRLFGKLRILGRSLKTCINVVDLLKK